MTDIGVWTGALGPLTNWPIVPGHETVGDVVELGPDVDNFDIDDRVGGLYHGGQDGACMTCQQGLPQGCHQKVANGVSKHGGCKPIAPPSHLASQNRNHRPRSLLTCRCRGRVRLRPSLPRPQTVAEYCILHTNAAVKIPKDVKPARVAPFLCAGVTVFNSVRHQNIMPGKTVAMHGIDGLGHLAIQYARKMGYRVVAISSGDSKLKLAIELGSHEYIDASRQDPVEALVKLGGAKMIICTAPDAKTIGQYVVALQWQGKLLILALKILPMCPCFPLTSLLVAPA
ncbi:uncharacterized protein FTOL_11910 [Fusarium torulosum]|uniref:Alcohol dehydrogenase n=1 Tax=Fusarium torulosum TaxID=33205 RepID=A0AAE8SNB2_9HYPO|nr:uncharacterized protein FTOL_11910 [Fusarium torulosum]